MSQQSESTQATPATENVEQTTEKKQLTRDELKEAICKQVEYYFSRQNLSTDHYLVSQMSHDLFVPVSVIANFKMIKTLTNDLDLICEAVKNSNQVILDAANKKLKPNIVLKRNTVIIRDISQNVPKEEILKLFSHDNQPVNIHSDIGNTWFTSFETEEKTIEAVQHLKTQQWDEKPIQARIKTESLLKTVGTTPTPQTPQNGYQYSYNNNRGNRKFNNNNRTNQNNGSQQPKERSFNKQQQTSPSTSATTTPQSSQNGNRNNNNNNNNNNRGTSQRGGRTRSNSGSRNSQASNVSKQTRPRKDMLNLSSTKSFPPLPKMNETEQAGYGNQKFLRYSKQTVMSVYMEQQEKGEHDTKPEILNGTECIAILKEPKKDLELHKPQMDKSQLANQTLPLETEKEGTTPSVQSVKPTNLLIPKSSFAEAAITAKDIKTPDTPSTSHFFAKSRKRRGSNAPAHTLTHQKPHYSKPQKSETKETKEPKQQSKTNVATTESSAPSINVTNATPVLAPTTSTDQPVSWVSVVANKK
ncbi:predicted protein [Naegleria gruberi]|uniref:Predicted protein n=1 Tax=Naegleria gruberi TaxID=5762 RepID=D2UZS9_NAEGR|nr:uncharacterized protein NAEGRDRAFT_56657 [Naegleria gruberi]EFC50215.1 predicted protein [Naegleria gruberi]|eukprot:XP_002682959.1 predicted protein [Naegleria gruberi strain NEG-M]